MKYRYRILMNENNEFIIRRETHLFWRFWGDMVFYWGRLKEWGLFHPWTDYPSNMTTFTDVRAAVQVLQELQEFDRKEDQANRWSVVLEEER